MSFPCLDAGLGLISAGTNNSRVGTLLRQLADYYAKDADCLLVVRVAQGLNTLGQGLLTLSPFHSDRLLLQQSALAAVFAVLYLALDTQTPFLDSGSQGRPQYLYLLAAAMNPRYLVTVEEVGEEAELVSVATNVRVGLAVETVGQAGRPKTITGFQTHSTPVLLGAKDRAEFANRDYAAVASVIEGVVIVRKVEESQQAV